MTQISPPTPTKRDAKLAKRLRKALADSVARQRIAETKRAETRIAVDGSNGRHVNSITLPVAPQPVNGHPVLRDLPRRQISKPGRIRESRPPQMQITTIPKVSQRLLLQRLWVWASVFIAFNLKIWADVLRRRNTKARRAVHLRRSIEQQGGTLLRIAQQMSLRLDILPVRYCEQLAMMRDSMSPFKTIAAIAIIEQAMGQKLNLLFSTFDPVPIESTSVGCVYQAVLHENGEKVAVKVRRPGIHVLFEADLHILILLTHLAEKLSILPPGYAEGFYKELQKTLRDELDFRHGARYEELFGRRANKAKKRFFTTRRIYFAHEQVLVRQFASGMWLWEVLASLENEDEEGMRYMQSLNLNPRKLAKRLLFIHHWSVYEHLTFYASPAPSNIIVGANNHITFVDFGTNGYLSVPRRELFRRFHQYQSQRDVWGMAQTTVALLEPLPARDINTLAKELELTFYEHLLAINSKQSYWYERTGAAMWLAAFKILNKYRIPAPTDLLMLVRAILLYDTLAARLWPRINYGKALQRYTDDVEERMRKKSVRQFRQRAQQGLFSGLELGAVESVIATGGELLFRIERLLNTPYDFAVLPLTIEKWVFTLTTFMRCIIRVALLTALGVAISGGYSYFTTRQVSLDEVMQQVFSSTLYWLAVIVISLMQLRILMFRLVDKTRK